MNITEITNAISLINNQIALETKNIESSSPDNGRPAIHKIRDDFSNIAVDGDELNKSKDAIIVELNRMADWSYECYNCKDVIKETRCAMDGTNGINEEYEYLEACLDSSKDELVDYKAYFKHSIDCLSSNLDRFKSNVADKLYPVNSIMSL